MGVDPYYKDLKVRYPQLSETPTWKERSIERSIDRATRQTDRYVHTNTHKHICIQIHIHTIQLYIHTYIHTYTHNYNTHKHTDRERERETREKILIYRQIDRLFSSVFLCLPVSLSLSLFLCLSLHLCHGNPNSPNRHKRSCPVARRVLVLLAVITSGRDERVLGKKPAQLVN